MNLGCYTAAILSSSSSLYVYLTNGHKELQACGLFFLSGPHVCMYSFEYLENTRFYCYTVIHTSQDWSIKQREKVL